jgi:transcriptional regulator with XRE-family HTH domain
MPRSARTIEGLGQSPSRELVLLGQNLRIARKRRGMSQRDFSARMMVSVPTLLDLEKGSPTVSIGVFVQALTVLGMEQQLAGIIAPEKDSIGMGLEIRRIQAKGCRKKTVVEDLDF